MPTIELQPHDVKGQYTDGEYKFWKADGRVHWALMEWPDDGLGLPGHGSAPTLQGAVQAAHSDRLIRQECREAISC